MTKLTDRRIAWLIRQAQGTAVPRETVGQMAARWGVTPRWLRKLLQRWRQWGVVPRLTPRRRPPGPPLTDEQKRQITEEWLRAPRGATKLYKALARRGIHIPKIQIRPPPIQADPEGVGPVLSRQRVSPQGPNND